MGCATAAKAPPPPSEPPSEQYARTPEQLLTPATVDTRIGRLEFFDGLPAEATVEAVYEHLDFMRGVRAYLQALPGVSMMAMRNGLDEAGMLPNYTVLLTRSLLDSKSLFLTEDTESIYAIAWISLKGGPIVVETPPRVDGLFVDAWQRPLGETGKEGADRGRGGRYVIVPPQYAGYVPRTKYAIESSTFGVWAVFRGYLSKGSPKRAVQELERGLKIYPIREAKRPPPNMFVDVSGKAFSTVAPTDFSFFELLNELVQEEPNEAQGAELLGTLASIGIEKDRRFEPDERMREILSDAAAVGNGTARALLFVPRDETARLFEDRQWERVVLAARDGDRANGALSTDARVRFHMLSNAVAPSMASFGPESRSDAAVTFRDRRGQLLDGGRTYAVTLPADVPAAYFWSMTLYDDETRSMLQTGQRFPSILSGQQGLRQNEDGSITLRFGPREPRDRRQRDNWIQTTPGTGWFAILRLYGPGAPWFDRSWRPGDIELLPEIARVEELRRPPTMRTEIPASIRTPSRIETRIGTLEFLHGVPDTASVERLYDNLDFVRGVDAFVSMLPGASLVAMRRGLREAGVTGNGVVGVFDEKMDAHSLFLTPDSKSVYAFSWLDLKDGALVVQSPPNTLGVVDDFLFRYVADLGNAGPDEGKGGLFLFVPPRYEGQISDLYFNFVSETYGNVLSWRVLAPDADPAPAVQNLKEHVEIYPLEIEISDEEIEAMEAAEGAGELGSEPDGDDASSESSQVDDEAVRFVSLSGKSMNTIAASDFHLFEQVDELVQEESTEALGPELVDLLRSIGISKGKHFAPDSRMRNLLVEAASVANATARVLAFRGRDPAASLYEDSGWTAPFIGNSHRFERRGVRLQDARTRFFYLSTMTTPTMVDAKLGRGSQYALCATDASGRYLDGGMSYRLRLPPNIPAKNFWSIVVYDPQTRSMLQAPGSATPSLGSQTGAPMTDADGTTTLYFGPKAPAGKEANWIQTVPRKGWFAILQLYGPLQSWFDGSWRPSEIERTDGR
jgi:hypothetical protein